MNEQMTELFYDWYYENRGFDRLADKVYDQIADAGLTDTERFAIIQKWMKASYLEGRTSGIAGSWQRLTSEELGEIWNCFCDERGNISVSDSVQLYLAFDESLMEKNS